ncbi:MAG: glycosyltransferase family 4 protein [Candidatus Heimdallarchaeota archaeon]|nr:glycosyltransferase family 4 protein [Candidatus Heimdallarchaeota archaeon]
MRILVLGIETDILDEGAKNVATNMVRHLSNMEEVKVIHQREVLLPRNIISIIKFSPQIVLSVHGPSPKTILLLAVIRLLTHKTFTVVIGTQPHDSPQLDRVLKYFGPNLVFAQSKYWHERFMSIGLSVQKLANGVDTEKFSERDKSMARAFKESLGLDTSRPLALHIGPVNFNRNHEILIRLQEETEWQVLVVGSTTENCLPHIVESLKKSGVVILVEYFPDISLVYCAADVYIFPVVDRTGSIEFPLTVLEAISCDIPVVTTRFRGLPDFLEEGEAFKYYDTFPELVQALRSVKGKKGNRLVSSKFSWNVIVQDLLDKIGVIQNC